MVVKRIPRIESIRVEPPTYMELKPFGHALLSFKAYCVELQRSFLICPFIQHTERFDQESCRIIDSFHASKTLYTPVKSYEEYLVVKSDGEVVLENSIPKQGVDIFKVNVIKQEEHELSTVDKYILKAIEKAEKIRNKKS
jgi:hypothetical protein